jgi:DNA repair exonuclease SbcCD ATPase subunit
MSASPLPRRRALSQLLGCATGLFTGLLPTTAPAQSQPTQNAWTAAQENIRHASRMAERVSGSLGSLGPQVRQAMQQEQKLSKSVQQLRSKLAELTERRDRLLEEFRNGKFCSGCNRTRSEILARGERFPHPGQTEVRPTKAQIEAKERELQAPIDRSQQQLNSDERDLSRHKADADNGVRQLRAGVLLWRTSVTYWSRAVQRGLQRRREELQQAVADLQTALEAEQRRISRLPAAEQTAAQSEARVWQRLLEEHQREIESFQQNSSQSVLQVSEQRRSQLDAMLRHLTGDPLSQEFNAANVNDAPIMSIENPLAMGVNFLMGRLPKPGDSFQNLGDVTAFVAEYRSFGALHIDAAGPGLATAGPPPVAAPPRAHNPLLQALP